MPTSALQVARWPIAVAALLLAACATTPAARQGAAEAPLPASVRMAASAQEVAVSYPHQPGQSPALHFQNAEALPAEVSAGDKVRASITYALVGAAGGVEVQERRSVLQGSKVIAEFPPETFRRTDGLWCSTVEIPVGDWPPGVYSIKTVVTANKESLRGCADFVLIR